MNKIQSWTIVFLLAVLTVAVCWHFYKTDQYRQEQLSIERVELGRGIAKAKDREYGICDLKGAHRYIKSDKRHLADRNKPPSTPSVE